MPEISPIYFSTLQIENVRCFGEHQVLDLTDKGRPARWNLLIGENGAGKTTLLECLVWMRPVPEVGNIGPAADSTSAGVIAPLTHGMLTPALTGERNEVLERLPRNGSQEVKLEAKLSFGGVGLRTDGMDGMLENGRSDAKNIRVSIHLSFDEHARLADVRSTRRTRIHNLGEAFYDPLIVSYGANRHLGDRYSLGIDELAPLDYERLARDTELCDIEEILMSLDYAVRTDGAEREVSSLKLLRDAMSRILPGHYEAERIEIYPPDVLDTGRPGGVYVKTFTGSVPMSGLSLGYRTTAGWVVDLAWRFLNHYPQSPNPLAEPAVVLIDEIDLHLHPRWQIEIMKELSSLFPATQFIATTHSPLMVQVAEEANLILLQRREDSVEIVNDPSVPGNLRVDQILTSLLFGVPNARGERVRHLLERRTELMDKARRSPEDEDLLNDVRRELDELPTAQDEDDERAMNLIRQFAGRLTRLETDRPFEERLGGLETDRQ